jgi:hypothetical protein
MFSGMGGSFKSDIGYWIFDGELPNIGHRISNIGFSKKTGCPQSGQPVGWDAW